MNHTFNRSLSLRGLREKSNGVEVQGAGNFVDTIGSNRFAVDGARDGRRVTPCAAGKLRNRFVTAEKQRQNFRAVESERCLQSYRPSLLTVMFN